jgi:hypothetical protein
VEGRPFDQRAHPGQDGGAALRHRGAEQFDVAAIGVQQAEQHPDRGGLARPVRAEEAVHRPVGHLQVDAVDRHLFAERAGQPAGAHREPRACGVSRGRLC